MNPEQVKTLIAEINRANQQAIKEAHLAGVQSGKKETSGLVDLIMHKMEGWIENMIAKYVNGKIDELRKLVAELIDINKKQADDLVTIKAEQERVRLQQESMQTKMAGILTDTNPIVEKFKDDKVLHKYVGIWGARIIKTSSVLIALGVIYGAYNWLHTHLK